MRKSRMLLFAALALAAGAATFAVLEASYGRGGFDSSRRPGGPTREIAFAANAVAGTVSLIDVERRTIIGTLNVIPDGRRPSPFRDIVQNFAQPVAERRGGLNYVQDTDLSRDGRVLFVSRGFLADVAAFEIASGDLLWRTPIAGLRADHMAISPDGTRLYVSALIRGGDVVEVLDTASGRKRGRFDTGRWPHDVHVSSGGARIYAASLGDMQKDRAARGADADAYKIVVADAETLAVSRAYRFDSGISPFQVTRDETRLYAQLSNTHAVVAHDLKADRRLARLDLPVADGVTPDDWDFEAPHHGLALSPDETLLCAAGRASDYAALVETGGLQLVGTVPTGNAPSWAEFSGSGRECLLANTRSDDVSVVDTQTAEEVARIDVGRGPKHITIGRVPLQALEQMSRRPR